MIEINITHNEHTDMQCKECFNIIPKQTQYAVVNTIYRVCDRDCALDFINKYRCRSCGELPEGLKQSKKERYYCDNCILVPVV